VCGEGKKPLIISIISFASSHFQLFSLLLAKATYLFFNKKYTPPYIQSRAKRKRRKKKKKILGKKGENRIRTIHKLFCSTLIAIY
jgi:hypothetical protein